AIDEAALKGPGLGLLVDSVVETCSVRSLSRGAVGPSSSGSPTLLNVLFKPGVTDNVALSAKAALNDLKVPATAVATVRKYWLNDGASEA
ncbi:hypothetical protein ACS26L_27220, partial [Bacillus cereus group sp. BC2]|uniref:hypothetical protein n=1 Tax=Bacillus cereus group sp. BC2 TaxID=3445343 RepID=UPI003F2639A0